MVGLAAIPAGWLSDRWSCQGMMVISFLGTGLSSVLCGLVSSPRGLFMALVLLGCFAAIYHPVSIPWLVRSSEKQGMALGINGIFGPLGVALASLIAGILCDLYGWRAAFIVPGLACVATGLVLWGFVALKLMRNDREDRVQHQDEKITGGARLRVFFVLLCSIAVVGFIFQATQASLPKFFTLELGGSVRRVAFFVSCVYFLGGTMQIVGGRLADRMPLKQVYLLGLSVQLPILLLMASVSGGGVIPVAALAVTLSTFVLPAENLLLARFSPPGRRGLVFGAKFVLAFGIAPVAITAVAWIQDVTGGFSVLFILLALVAGLGACAAAFLPAARPA